MEDNFCFVFLIVCFDLNIYFLDRWINPTVDGIEKVSNGILTYCLKIKLEVPQEKVKVGNKSILCC